MADILIRGMEMPKEGEKILIAADGSVWVNAWPTRGYMRMENVHAVPLPEGHGGLCDRDALIKELQNLFDKREKDAAFSGNRGPSVTWNDAICSIFAAPIIVPAEGDKTDGD